MATPLHTCINNNTWCDIIKDTGSHFYSKILLSSTGKLGREFPVLYNYYTVMGWLIYILNCMQWLKPFFLAGNHTTWYTLSSIIHNNTATISCSTPKIYQFTPFHTLNTYCGCCNHFNLYIYIYMMAMKIWLNVVSTFWDHATYNLLSTIDFIWYL